MSTSITSPTTITLRAVPVRQGKRVFYSFTLQPEQLLACGIEPLTRQPDGTLDGYQRAESTRKTTSGAEYICNPPPNTDGLVIPAVNAYTAGRVSYDPDTGMLTLDLSTLRVYDGQHRTLMTNLAKSRNDWPYGPDGYQLAVSVLPECPPQMAQALFAWQNSTQTPLSASAKALVAAAMDIAHPGAGDRLGRAYAHGALVDAAILTLRESWRGGGAFVNPSATPDKSRPLTYATVKFAVQAALAGSKTPYAIPGVLEPKGGSALGKRMGAYLSRVTEASVGRKTAHLDDSVCFGNALKAYGAAMGLLEQFAVADLRAVIQLASVPTTGSPGQGAATTTAMRDGLAEAALAFLAAQPKVSVAPLPTKAPVTKALVPA